MAKKNRPAFSVIEPLWFDQYRVSKQVLDRLGIPTKARAVFFFKLGLAQSREDPPGLKKCLGLLKIGPLQVFFKLFEFSRQKYFKI